MIQMIQTLHSCLRDNTGSLAGSLFGLVPMHSMPAKSSSKSSSMPFSICFRGLAHFFASLLIGCLLLLSACGGGGGGGSDGGSDPTLLAVTGLTVIPNNNSLSLRWTNPVTAGEDNLIAGFNISWQQVVDGAPTGEVFRAQKTDDLGSGMPASYEATTGIENGNTYRVTLLLLLNSTNSANRRASVQTVPEAVPGSNLDNDTLPDILDDDIDGDGINNEEDNCPQNTDQADVNQDGEGDACEEDPADIPATMGVIGLSVASTETSLILSWINPSVGFIDAFEITWFPSDDRSDSDSSGRLDDETSVSSVNNGTIASETRTAYTISRLTTDTNYTVAVTLIADEDNSYTNRVFAVTVPNLDGDAYADAEDVDDDNNGLIEIYTLDDLAWLRDDLNADGIDDGNDDNITAPGNAGCPELGCNGYELMRSLDFTNASSYADNSENMAEWTGEGWTPIGSCSGGALSTCRFYRGIFDGNHHNISHLKIRHPNVEVVVYGLGLFAGLDSGTMRNLQLLDASYSSSKFPTYVGLLVGWAFRSQLENVHVMRGTLTLTETNQPGNVARSSNGGLVGRATESMLIRTSVSDSRISVLGGTRAGGLLGLLEGSNIVSSYAADTSVFAASDVGGLGGFSSSSTRFAHRGSYINASYANRVDVEGAGQTRHIGGLIGFSELTLEITASYATGGNIKHRGTTGIIAGIVGVGATLQISASLASFETSNTVFDAIGGIVGVTAGIPSSTTFEDNYWDLNTTDIPASRSGRFGTGKTTEALQSQTTFEGIYANWGDFWCDPDTGEFTTDADDSDLAIDANRAWNLGNSTQYPALTCTSGGAERQRQ